MRFVIVTGLSGAGKTHAIRSLEDLGYFCVDNLPPTLISKFAEACFQAEGKIDRIALVIDIRGGEFFHDLFENLSKLENAGYKYEILFLDASDEVLVKRYKESRRKHPLSPQGRVIKGIELERLKLKQVRNRANNVIDTSNLTTRELREKITQIYEQEGQMETQLIITVLSFGFKYGIPVDSDLVFDVRFLPNPFYIQDLKYFSGNDKPVSDYVLGFEETRVFIDKLADMLEYLIPHYLKEGKRQLIVSIGCTGGRHRSVTIANSIYSKLKASGHNVNVDHRDINEDVNKGGKKL
ncbi:nucleotide-binding protein [Clostridium pasteurianum DSM 525 = ATCC 6013]|uniref:Nucleotide-binding protein n=1 Tax=Clostridium pasteurianum DSM 525 = ATCC 6013 TaxID=1262449 RepID=A0A0H3J5W2_CLOPA|nr:RNase adapter RapZ [Clostridium pasteurianum]AJA48839.1 nucleotide-binding protein [Clostridium pasteurianum DSM 525 = ATCC 6013]AJA52827.1 nucleotide-binding protein [Clostridium pasteurianum DSM 525 = ATCC 6013]AOZ76051.1 glmZ(sRNA)-inactivating NTPase [Clostridium pasteurianum DSM 525 = ATCC 6013]AOZ79847.1 glmZ(sRNA)-inactivating NTPase [Clostridium pasteurianum]ELP60135.1 glmZ(sRNA)-inactivating NTPase [Clostridium pasteurianum DSM 525 = ATCC 6013]